MKVLISVTLFTLWVCNLSFASGTKIPDGSVDVPAAVDAKKQEGQIGTSHKTAGKQLGDVEKVLKEQKGTPDKPTKEPVEKPKKGN